jgi:uncharacterized protein
LNVFRKMMLALVAAAVLNLGAAPAVAQNYSDGYKFLKAVKERDGNTAESMLAGSGARLVNTKDITSGEGALHILARERDMQWLGFMLSKGARADIQNKEGETPLILATQLGWVEGATRLIRAGAKVDGANGRGETPLILAVHKRDLAMIRLLLANGADPRRSDRVAGYSALDYAKRDDRTGTIVRLLEEAKPAKAAAGPPR